MVISSRIAAVALNLGVVWDGGWRMEARMQDMLGCRVLYSCTVWFCSDLGDMDEGLFSPNLTPN